MRRRSVVFAKLFLLSVSLSLVANPDLTQAQSSSDPQDHLIISMERDRIQQLQAEVPEFQQYTAEELAAGLEKAIGLERVKDLPLIEAAVVQLGAEIDQQLFQDLIAEGFVDYIEPEQEYHAFEQETAADFNALSATTPNDPRFAELWGMNNSGQSGGTPDVDIDAPESWGVLTDTGTLVVGVVDTGIDYRHPDLAANMWVNNGEIPGNNIDDDHNGYIDDIYGINAIRNDGDPLDDHYHGTHCAGTIGARGNDSVGVVGAAWGVRLMGLKFLSSSGSGYTSDAVEAINYAVMMKQRGVNIRVLSNSWGGSGYSQALRDAIAAANSNGIVFVAAAGNNAANTDVGNYYPANYDVSNVISVAAVDRTGALASFSNYGATKVHVAAPGVSILSTAPSNTYRLLSGTSMATPHVSGAAALILASRPSLVPADLRQLLISTSKPLAALNGKTVSRGIISAYRALTGDTNFPPAVREINNQVLNIDAGYLELDVQATDAEADPLTYSVAVSPANLVTAQFTGNKLRLTPLNNTLGESTITISVSDGPHTSRVSFKLTVHHNSAPVIPVIADQKLRRGVNRTIFTGASDPEGDRLVASARVTPANAATLYAYSNAVIVQAAPTFVGDAVIEYSVSDAYSTSKRTFSVRMRENEAPVITAPERVATQRVQRLVVPIDITDPNDDTVQVSAEIVPADAARVLLATRSSIVVSLPQECPPGIDLKVMASDGVLSSERVVAIAVTDNHSPVISEIPPYVTPPGVTLAVPYSVIDPDGDSVTVTAALEFPLHAPSLNRPTVNVFATTLAIVIPASWKLPFKATVTARDATSTTRRSFLVRVREQAGAGIDSDGDGVSDEDEERDGTDLNDRGSHLAPASRVLCGEWNGFLGGMWNIKELINRSAVSVRVRTTLYTIDGRPRESTLIDLEPGSQRDLAVHDMQGWIRNSYGKVCTEILTGELGAVDGRMVYYKPDGRGGFQFAFAMPLIGGITGEQHVLFNTFQPSLAAQDQNNLRVNWIQLTNLDEQEQAGALSFYDLDGTELGHETVVIQAGARRDFAGHRFGDNHVGLVSWKPEDPQALFQLRNVRYYYDNPRGVESFDGAFQLEGAIGSGAELAGPVNTASGSAVVEIANTTDAEVIASLRITDASGVERANLRKAMSAHSSWHVIVDPFIANGVGSVKVRGGVSGSLVGTVMEYGRAASGGITFLYGVPLVEPVSESFHASYNTFLSQSCELMLVNANSNSVSVLVQMTNFSGEQPIHNRVIEIPGEGVLTQRICDADKLNRYGVVSILSEQRNSVVGTLIRLGKRDQYRFPVPVR